MDNDHCCVGAYNAMTTMMTTANSTTTTTNTGAVYCYRRSTNDGTSWCATTKLTPNISNEEEDAAPGGMMFGTALFMDNWYFAGGGRTECVFACSMFGTKATANGWNNKPSCCARPMAHAATDWFGKAVQ